MDALCDRLVVADGVIAPPRGDLRILSADIVDESAQWCVVRVPADLSTEADANADQLTMRFLASEDCSSQRVKEPPVGNGSPSRATSRSVRPRTSPRRPSASAGVCSSVASIRARLWIEALGPVDAGRVAAVGACQLAQVQTLGVLRKDPRSVKSSVTQRTYRTHHKLVGAPR